ncbi:O-methyltransferase [Flindersiella endophytica]
MSTNVAQVIDALAEGCRRLGFEQSSGPLTGALLRSLAASKPDGSILELGTGVGISTAWLVDGMSPGATLLTVDNAADQLALVEQVLGDDSRLTIVHADGADLLTELNASERRFDLIFADTWPGKFTHREPALRLLAPGGLYVVDDLLPQPTWPADHKSAVDALCADLTAREDLAVVEVQWSTGLLIATRRPTP